MLVVVVEVVAVVVVVVVLGTSLNSVGRLRLLTDKLILDILHNQHNKA